MDVAKDLATITSRVLSSLGEPTMQALYWELSTQGVTANPEEFDISKFDEGMRKIFGDGANVFMDEIYSQFKQHVEKQYPDGDKMFAEIDENFPAIMKIQRVLSLKVTT
jgi:hypothetical protein